MLSQYLVIFIIVWSNADFKLFLSLAGCLSGSTVVMIFPAAFWLKINDWKLVESDRKACAAFCYFSKFNYLDGVIMFQFWYLGSLHYLAIRPWSWLKNYEMILITWPPTQFREVIRTTRHVIRSHQEVCLFLKKKTRILSTCTYLSVQASHEFPFFNLYLYLCLLVATFLQIRFLALALSMATFTRFFFQEDFQAKYVFTLYNIVPLWNKYKNDFSFLCLFYLVIMNHCDVITVRWLWLMNMSHQLSIKVLII